MEVLRFALLGLATGTIYALLAQGLVLIYRGSGVVNFAQGAVAMFGAFAYYELSEVRAWPALPALAVALAACGVLGVAIQWGIMRPLRHAAALSRVIATLAVVMILQSGAFLVYGHETRPVASLLPTDVVRLGSDKLTIGQDRIYIFAICLILSVALFLIYRYSAIGRLTSAVAESDIAAASLGYSPNMIASANWAIGSVLAGLAGILVSPLIFLEPTALVLLVVPALAAALLGGFKSFSITLVAALCLGIAQSELQRYVDEPGWGTALPFLVVMLVLVARGRSLPLRSFLLERQVNVGNGKIRWGAVIPLSVLVLWWAWTSDADWALAITSTAAVAIICLSVVVITGYTGQLSLAQYVLAGAGALIAARAALHMNFILAVAVAVIATALIGAVIGLPALRTRGIILAVVTLGLASAIVAVVLNNNDYTGNTNGSAGILIDPPSIFGLALDPVLYPNRYATLVVLVLIAASLWVCRLRLSNNGRRMLAVRSNERAAATLGINVPAIKTYSFMIAAAMAALGGTLLAFTQPVVTVNRFDLFTSIVIVAVVVVGGVGYVPGAIIGALAMPGGIVSHLLEGVGSVNDYLPLAGGILLILNLLASPDGIFELNARGINALKARIRPTPAPAAPAPPPEVGAAISITPQELAVKSLSVSFGGVKALDSVSLTVRPGEVHGLIGPNGAGKTTLIDAVSGLVKSRTQSITMGDKEITTWSARRRAGMGLSRSFQSMELFTGLSIKENLAVADTSTKRSRARLLPGRTNSGLGPAAMTALTEFRLVDDLDKLPQEVSFGRRKLVAIARAIATAPSILMLDEPAAGLDDFEANELATLIRALADKWGIGILLVEHKVDMVMSISDRVTVLAGGRTLASGTPAEITNNSEVIDAYLGTPDSENAEPL